MLAVPTTRAAILSGAFGLRQLPGLRVLLDGSGLAGLADGDPVSQWDDLSGAGNHAAQATGSKQPTKRTVTNNGKTFAVARLDGVDDFLQTPAVSLGQFTVFCVFKATATNGALYEQSASASANPGSGLFTNQTTVRVNRGGTISAKNNTASWGLDGVWKVVTHRYGGTHALHQLYVNGSPVSTTDVTTNDPGSASVSDVVYVGARAGSANFVTGDYYALALCNAFVSDPVRLAVERILGATCGIGVS